MVHCVFACVHDREGLVAGCGPIAVYTETELCGAALVCWYVCVCCAGHCSRGKSPAYYLLWARFYIATLHGLVLCCGRGLSSVVKLDAACPWGWLLVVMASHIV